MFVFTIDQVDSRHTPDAVRSATDAIAARYGDAIMLGPDRTAGDEFQVLIADAAVALDVALRLARTARWSIGLGIGAVDTPLPTTTREATGRAFVLAREAVDAAKAAQHRVAIRADPTGTSPIDAAGVQACIDLLLTLRSGRTEAGWEVADLLADGSPQVEVARRLGVSPQAVSLRVRAAGIRTELAALPALAALLSALDAADSAARG